MFCHSLFNYLRHLADAQVASLQLDRADAKLVDVRLAENPPRRHRKACAGILLAAPRRQWSNNIYSTTSWNWNSATLLVWKRYVVFSSCVNVDMCFNILATVKILMLITCTFVYVQCSVNLNCDWLHKIEYRMWINKIYDYDRIDKFYELTEIYSG